jgi:SAM-dependent methyltransferase
MFNELLRYAVRPPLYAPSTSSLWDDEHISKGMLEAHLNPHLEAATRKHEFLDKSVNWISQIAPPLQYNRLLDLGCGPGLYAERFYNAGYSVIGIDFSKRSIAYATEQAQLHKSDIEYLYQDYLTIAYQEHFDLVMLLYCDYAALSITDRGRLLKKVYKALKPGWKFILDVFSTKMRKTESQSWHYSENGGFYSEKSHICLNAVYQYDDDDQTELRRSVVITDESLQCYNVWDHYFNKETFISEIQSANFKLFNVYGDVAGSEFSETGETICGIFTK